MCHGADERPGRVGTLGELSAGGGLARREVRRSPWAPHAFQHRTSD